PTSSARPSRRKRRPDAAARVSQNAARKIANWGHSSDGRAREWHSRGRRFDPAWLHQPSLASRATARQAEERDLTAKKMPPARAVFLCAAQHGVADSGRCGIALCRKSHGENEMQGKIALEEHVAI